MTVKLQKYIAKYNYTFLPLLLKISNIILFCSPSSIFSSLIHFSSSYTSTPPTVPSILPPPASPTPHLSPPPIPPPPSLCTLFLILHFLLTPQPPQPPPPLPLPLFPLIPPPLFHLFFPLSPLPRPLPIPPPTSSSSSSSSHSSSLTPPPYPPPPLLLPPPLLKVPESERCFAVCSSSPDSCWMVERDLREETVMVPYLSTMDTSRESCRGWGNERRGGK